MSRIILACFFMLKRQNKKQTQRKMAWRSENVWNPTKREKDERV
ncbi:hypothetical protein ACVPOW_14920 [Staphylococcus aureus]